MTQEREKTTASLNVDMDPIDHYLHTRGWSPLEGCDTNAIYDDALPRMLDIFDEYGVKATFFVVGKDIGIGDNAAKLSELVERGHEVGNHTMTHNLGLADLGAEEKRCEILEMQKRAEDATGQPIRGFRAPGWNIDKVTLAILGELGYVYDSSILPSLLNPLIQAAYRIQSRGRGKRLLGHPPALACAPRGPYRPDPERIWRRGQNSIVEIPTSVLPGIRFPFYGTMNLFLGETAFKLGAAWFRSLSTAPLNYVLHALELVDKDKVGDDRLEIKPGYMRGLDEKIQSYHTMLATFQERYRFVRLCDIATTVPK